MDKKPIAGALEGGSLLEAGGREKVLRILPTVNPGSKRRRNALVSGCLTLYLCSSL